MKNRDFNYDSTASSRIIDESGIFERVYSELKNVARKYMNLERADHTLQPTALIHEAYLKLSRNSSIQWKSRTHFIAIAARAMRQVLVDHAKKHNALKRQQDSQFTVTLITEYKQIDMLNILALNRALNKLAKQSPNGKRHVSLIQLIYFGGLTMKEAAQELGVSQRTAQRDWKWSSAWLAKDIAYDRIE